VTVAALEGGIWSAQGTTPTAVEEALRDLLRERHCHSDAFVPARVLNLVVVADREWRGEIQNRLERVGRYHASRTILCAVDPGRKAIDARVAVASPYLGDGSGGIEVGQEEIVLDIAPHHLEHLDSIVDPLVVTDLATLVWSPHGHPDAVDALMDLAQVVLVDSVNEPDPAQAVRRADELAERAYIVDLAWLRSTPWRERVAATFDPPEWRGDLDKISAVTVRHSPDSVIAGLLFLGWMATRLGWRPGAMVSHGGVLQGTAHGRRQDVRMRLEPDTSMSTPGFAGLTVETASGMSVSLDRGPGGLSACRTDPEGREWRWTAMGASRGEAGILGEGIRQALLRDKTYGPALAAVGSMVAG
jgi:glucose-6-phosphate dehydrogenase assembly protein OpcA